MYRSPTWAITTRAPPSWFDIILLFGASSIFLGLLKGVTGLHLVVFTVPLHAVGLPEQLEHVASRLVIFPFADGWPFKEKADAHFL